MAGLSANGSGSGVCEGDSGALKFRPLPRGDEAPGGGHAGPYCPADVFLSLLDGMDSCPYKEPNDSGLDEPGGKKFQYPGNFR